MKKAVLINLIIVIFINFTFENNVFSWDNGVTHRDLSEYAADNSVLSVDKGDYLKNLGFRKELLEEFKWDKKRTAKDWLREGAELEDYATTYEATIGNARYQNHFHNPTEALWDDAGLNDIKTGMSSLLWAQDGAAQSGYSRGDQSWQKIRNYYYLAVTSTTDTERLENFARTFQGQGRGTGRNVCRRSTRNTAAGLLQFTPRLIQG